MSVVLQHEFAPNRERILLKRSIPIENRRLDDSTETYGDDIERVVSWKNEANISRLAGKPVRFRFVMKDADLYSTPTK